MIKSNPQFDVFTYRRWARDAVDLSLWLDFDDRHRVIELTTDAMIDTIIAFEPLVPADRSHAIEFMCGMVFSMSHMLKMRKLLDVIRTEAASTVPIVLALSILTSCRRHDLHSSDEYMALMAALREVWTIREGEEECQKIFLGL